MEIVYRLIVLYFVVHIVLDSSNGKAPGPDRPGRRPVLLS